ncbi:MAG: mitochondrial large ribosomal subunit protein uL15m [Candidatus Blackburnbacteria bacterium]|nr:mitochondrial large ribosomal subunit protein uL15m [Candidatus Blackburnbacteria bacterium]
MRIHELPKIVQKGKKRLGRGYGSGRGGHTSSRGQKGQKTRGKIHPLFEGAKTKKSLIQRLPLLRGKGRLKSRRQKPVTIDIGKLDSLPVGALVNIELLVKAGIISPDAKKTGVKLLGAGGLSKKLTIALPATRGAVQKIEAAGGTLVK